MSLLDAAERFASLDRSQVLLDTKRCLHAQDQFSDCTDCFEVCPVQAIASGKPPALNLEACQSCFACLPVCPAGAFHADDAVASLLNCAGRIESGPVELVCGMHPHPDLGTADALGIRVTGCLAGLGAGAYLMLASLGLEKVIVRTDACEGCVWGSLRERVEMQVSQTRLFLAAWGRADGLICESNAEKMVQRPAWDSKNPPLSRRDMFRMLAQQGKMTMARAMESRQKAFGRVPGRDRLRLLTAVKHLPPPEPAPGLPIGPRGFAVVAVSEDCNACGVCGRACPTEALRFNKSEDGTLFSLRFSAQACIGCDLCAHVCASSAISVDRAPLFSQVFGMDEMTLQAGELIKCDGCGALIAKRENFRLCSLCEYRREHPFGSRLPPSVQLRSEVK